MKIGQLYVLIAAFIWGVSAVVRKILVSNISPYSLVFLSTMLATFFLFITHNKIIRREINSLDKNKFKNYLSLAITGSIAAPLLFNYGIKLLDVSVVVVIERIQPVFTLILAYILLKERFPNQFYFLSFVCLFSSVILAAKSLDLSSIISVNYIGIFMIFGAALGWAMAAVIAKRMLISVEPIPLLFFRLAITSFVLLPVFYINGYYTVIFQLTTTEIILISFIAIFSLCISFSLFYHGLKLIKVGLASVLELVTPVVGIMFSFLILKESYNLIQVISCIVILISTYKLATLKD